MKKRSVVDVQMAPRYLVQTWGTKGELTNNYEVSVPSDPELKQLKSFLNKKWAHVVLTPVK